MKNRKSSSFDSEIVRKNIEQYGAEQIRNSNIRVIRILSNIIESETGKKFIRLEMGVPSVKPSKYGIDAEIEALNKDVAGVYPPIDGIPELKQETSRFAKNFLDVDVSPASCLATVGSINGNYASFMLCGRRHRGQDTILFIDPGFPPQKQIAMMLGLKQKSFDIYKYRGQKLRSKLEEMLEDKTVAAMIYSNPNNPSWMCFTDEELEIIAEMADKYNAIVIEDLAYFAMDFRKDLSKPGVPPYQNTVAKYTDNYILLISSSKIFSYAGQRIGMMLISDKIFSTQFPDLSDYFATNVFGPAMILGALLLTSAGVGHSAQYALHNMFKMANEGKFDFVEETKVYGQKAKKMKEVFLNNGFDIVYDKDGDEPIADGFYFTVSYPGYEGDKLCEELLYYGISTIPLTATGSDRTEGIRICVSLISEEEIPELGTRLEQFAADN